MNYQFQKKEKTLALGVWPQTSLVEARHKRDEAKMLLKSGKDPNLEKKKLKSNAVLDQGNSFGSISEEWFERMQHEWSEDYFHDSKRASANDACSNSHRTDWSGGLPTVATSFRNSM